MSQLLYQCFFYSNTFLMVLKKVIFWYVQVTYKSYLIITFFLGLSLGATLYYVTTTLFQIPKKCILNNIRNTGFTGTLLVSSFRFTKTGISNKVRYTSFFRLFKLLMEITLQLRYVLFFKFTVCIFFYVRIT